MANEDVDVAFLLCQFIQLLGEKPERSCWVHPINQKRDIGSFIVEIRSDPNKFYNYCRLSIATFDHLLALIQENNTNYRNSISPEERLLITLR